MNGKPDRKKFPNLAKAWDEYGHSVKWEDLVGFKRATTHGYVVLAWAEGDGINYADLYTPDQGETWEMLNDGHETISQQTWQAAKIVPHCDRLDLPEVL